jgi:serine/threonine-protein kinase
MGEVYRADDLKLEHPVALKFLSRAFASDVDRLERLFSEVRIARQVSHPAVCRVWDVGEAEGHQFLSMEYVDGENLSSLLRRIGRFPSDKALDIARQVCAGLAAAHEKGVLHRDLKPANVMLDGQGKVRITDFGLAGLAESLGAEDVRSGTPSYMSPEQLLGREVTVRSDVYGLGLLLYELFTGRRAFTGRTLAELTRKHRDERPIEPSALVVDLAPAVERTILACLEKDPRRRPASALVVSAMLAGRDPLEAAIAAGETPSPELVAAAGETERLRPTAAWACLAAVVLGVFLVPVVQGPLCLLGRLPIEKAPAALEDRAHELLARIGNAAPAADSDAGLRLDEDYFDDVLKRDHSATRWDGMRTGVPPALQFWYRQSPRPLVATRSIGHTQTDDPPLAVTGMAGVSYDLTGRLVEFYAVPPQLESPGAAPPEPDWAGLFAAARLDLSHLRPVEPRWTPPFYADTRAAWEGAWPERPEMPLRVEAAAHRGRPVWFRLIGPWTRPERMERFVPTRLESIARVFAIVLLVAVTGTGAVLARRNIRLGRGDRRGAFRLALALSGLGMAGWILGAHHVTDLLAQLVQSARAAGIFVLGGALVWLFYLALEPYVRRLRPWTLVSWTRLLNGGLRDAVVGRDALIGMAWGVATALVFVLFYWLSAWLSLEAPPPARGHLQTLLGLRFVLALAVSSPVLSALAGLGALLLFLILRLSTRSDAAASILMFLLLGGNDMLQTAEWASPWLTAPLYLVFYGSYIFVLLRFGVLSAIAGALTLGLVIEGPLFPDVASWTGSTTVVVVPALLLMAVLAFRSALGGSTGLRRSAAAEAGSAS